MNITAQSGPANDAALASMRAKTAPSPSAIDHEANLREAEGLKAKVPGYCVPILDEIIRGYRSALKFREAAISPAAAS